jgi:hypothetical protein
LVQYQLALIVMHVPQFGHGAPTIHHNRPRVAVEAARARQRVLIALGVLARARSALSPGLRAQKGRGQRYS